MTQKSHTKITHKNHSTSQQKITQPLRKKIIAQPTEKNKSCNLSELVSEKNLATSPHTKTMPPLHSQNHATSPPKTS